MLNLFEKGKGIRKGRNKDTFLGKKGRIEAHNDILLILKEGGRTFLAKKRGNKDFCRGLKNPHSHPLF